MFHLEVEAVFYDLTSSYFEGTQAELGWFGYSRDERRSNLQIVVGLVMVDGLPVSHQVFKGSRRDATCLETALERIERRFKIRNVILVGDGGLLTQDNIEMLRRKKYEYILACRKRRDKHTRRAPRAQPDVPVYTDQDAERGKEPPKPVVWSLDAVDGDRLVGFTNPVTARRDRQRREEILETFREELHELQVRFAKNRRTQRDDRIKQLTELLVRRKKLGKRYFNAEVQPNGHLTYRVKQWVLRYESKIDGTTILKTNNKPDPENPARSALTDEDVVARYKELAQVERAFRDLKSFIDLRPMHHRVATRIASHVFVCVLALLFERIVERKLRAADVGDLSAETALRSLKRIQFLRDSVNGIEVERVSHIGADQRRVLRALEVAPPSPLVSVRPRKPKKRRKSR
jgi:transposase